jgi:hypothetical protein
MLSVLEHLKNVRVGIIPKDDIIIPNPYVAHALNYLGSNDIDDGIKGGILVNPNFAALCDNFEEAERNPTIAVIRSIIGNQPIQELIKFLCYASGGFEYRGEYLITKFEHIVQIHPFALINILDYFEIEGHFKLYIMARCGGNYALINDEFTIIRSATNSERCLGSLVFAFDGKGSFNDGYKRGSYTAYPANSSIKTIVYDDFVRNGGVNQMSNKEWLSLH